MPLASSSNETDEEFSENVRELQNTIERRSGSVRRNSSGPHNCEAFRLRCFAATQVADKIGNIAAGTAAISGRAGRNANRASSSAGSSGTSANQRSCSTADESYAAD
jgi:hypothetical protein